jgi:hypothetical protein
MPRQKIKLIDPIPVDADGIAAAQAVAGAGNLTLAGALTSGGTWTASDGLARKITITSAGDDSGDTFTITGTDAEGRAQTEVVTGANTSTAMSTKYFKTVTSIADSGAAAGNVSAGISKYFMSNIVPLNHYNTEAATVSVENISGTIDVTVQDCFGAVQTDSGVDFHAVAALSNISADTRSQITIHASGVRLVGNNYVTGAECDFVINQNGC